MRLPAALFLLIAAFLVLGVVYVVKTPYRQPGVMVHQRSSIPDIGAPDERQHANYVDSILDGRGFPVLRPGSPDLIETYQAHQPPLYYIVAAGFAKLVGADPANKETGGRLRYLNLLIGVVTLFGIFYAARWGLARDDVGLAAVAFTGLMPMFVALHAAVSNDPSLFAVCSWTLALCAKGVRQGWDWKTAAACGVLVGIGLVTKTNSLALLPTVFVALVVGWRVSGTRPGLSVWALALALPFLIGLPWMSRNQSLYGDPFAINAFQEAFVNSPRPQDVTLAQQIANGDPEYVAALEKVAGENPDMPPRELIDGMMAEVGWTFGARVDYWTDWVGWWVGRSYIGVLGYMDIFLLEGSGMTASDTFYRLVLLLLSGLAVAWVLSLRESDKATKAVYLVNATLLLAVLAMFVRFNIAYFQGQARYVYPAVAVISVGLGAGLCHILRRRREQAWMVAGVFLLIVQAFALQAIWTGFPLRAR